jgi:Putative quorum-sensing-regulated virulence factor
MAHVDASSVSLSFGKHRGVPLADVPRSYLEWTLAQGVLRSEALRPAVQAELVRQGSSSVRVSVHRDHPDRSIAITRIGRS